MKQQMLEAEAKELKARIEALNAERDAQCCMCGKKGLSTEEDGGTECELPDGRWVCSGDCWDDALEPDATTIREEALSEAISHARQALVNAANAYGGAKASAMFTAETHVTAALYKLINNPRKEVMPIVSNDPANQSDIGPGDQAVAGAAQDAILYGTGFMQGGKHVSPEDVFAEPEPVAGAASPSRLLHLSINP